MTEAGRYGVISSNEFKVKDMVAFLTWFKQYHFGDRIQIWGVAERTVSFRGYEPNASAYPRQIIEDDVYGDHIESVDLATFAREFAEHLEPGEAVNIVAGSNEDSRYVSYDQLVIAADYPDRPVYREVCSTWGKTICLLFIETGEGPLDR